MRVALAREFVDNPAVPSATHSLSRRTWLLASGSIALLGALPSCRSREPTRVPVGGPASAAPLSERGVRNLLALAELSAAIRWLHPSDRASALAWESHVLVGVRELEGADDPEQLAEGLRTLFIEVAPTVQLWRSASESGERLDEPAGSGSEVAQGESSPARAAPKRVRTPPPPPAPIASKAKQEDESETTDESGESETGESETTDETGESETGESKTSESETTESETTESETTDETSESETGESETIEEPALTPAPAAPPASKPPLEPQPRPPLPAELLRETEAIVQWRRRGFPGHAEREPIACAQRILRAPDHCVPPATRGRPRTPACAGCDDDFELLAPAAPLVVELARGLSAAIPLALWHTGGELEPPATFSAEQASEYTLDDRGTRLLAVIQTWSVLRWFSPYSLHDPLASLRAALCEAAERDAEAMPAILDALLASFADGNAERLDEAREFGPAAAFTWAADRVVALPLLDRPARSTPLQSGDVIVAIAGESIDTALADALARAAGSTDSARIARAVDQLFVRAREATQSGLRVEVLRETPAGGARLEVRLDHWLPVDERPSGADLRPRESLFELRAGLWYADLGRIPNLQMAARWLRAAKAVIVDLRGPMLDEHGSLVRHWLSSPIDLLDERILAGPTSEGRMIPRTIATHRLEPVPARRRLRCPVAVLADHRTRGRAEHELVGFDRLGMAIVGSTSAGDLGQTAQLRLPGGMRVGFSQTDMVRHDGTRIAGVGVAPTFAVEPSWPAVCERDELLERAQILLEGVR